MSKISISADTSIETLQAAIDMLRLQECKWRRSRSRRSLIHYLSLVYGLYAAWRVAGIEKKASARLAKLAKLQTRHGRHPIRTIIDATSKSDRRSKSRWVQALRYAYRKRKRWRSFERFLSNNGGISGCASKWADEHAYGRTPKGYVRLGGEGFPKVPMFIERELMKENPAPMVTRRVSFTA